MATNVPHKWLNTLLQGQEVQQFLDVKSHHGIRANADVVRLLIRHEWRRIKKLPDPDAEECR